jgi:hypothetical protein
MSRYKKVTLTIDRDLWTRLVARVPRRKISRYVSEAATRRLDAEERMKLRGLLKEQCQVRSERDLKMAQDFFQAEEEIEEEA